MRIQGQEIRSMEEELQEEVARLRRDLARINANRLSLLAVFNSLVEENEFWRAQITRLLYPETVDQWSNEKGNADEESQTGIDSSRAGYP